MATPLSADKIVAALRKWGVPYKEYRSWRTHNRNHRGAWGPVNGFMVHHTGSDSTDQRELLYGGVSGLPGPLCHFGLAQDGTVHLISAGRANHAGSGDDDVLRAVINESALPADDESNTDGNARFYGVEVWYSGSHRMTDAQYASLRKLAAAICDAHGWSAKSVIGHGEWGSPGKWDPGYAPGKMMDMDAVRADVAATLSKAAPKPAEPKPAEPVRWLKVEGFMPELSYGDSGWHVGWLQRNLNRFGAGLVVSERYDDATARAVHAFYAKYLGYGTDTEGRKFGAQGWRRVLSVAKDEKGTS